ncbi:flavodoxin I [Paenibacillus sp. UNCCL117]|uniref:flavodoxin n=1 Tax=unclassified Paenibacillus TaxID=185978 RepID=UPI0008902E4C|nr:MULTISPECIES: flavodoxin [unclassified Paenibacillus]SDD43571.1 flavodoxin I [Paenibacillus sp. cl123]SFW47340.1 flavodoxin I [Paenibacillus sp. UNCCL117]
MSSVIIVFASMTGNTEEMAELIAEGVRSAGIEPVLKSAMDTSAAELEKYDGVVLGAYTWGDGDLPDEMLDFYDEMDDIQLEGRKAAVFGSGDSSYRDFCGAVDTLAEKLKETGAELVLEAVKVELNPTSEEKEQCRRLGSALAALLA